MYNFEEYLEFCECDFSWTDEDEEELLELIDISDLEDENI